eukprot:7798963-Lingulodinium_polyedra.AAC.1
MGRATAGVRRAAYTAVGIAAPPRGGSSPSLAQSVATAVASRTVALTSSSRPPSSQARAQFPSLARR